MTSFGGVGERSASEQTIKKKQKQKQLLTVLKHQGFLRRRWEHKSSMDSDNRRQGHPKALRSSAGEVHGKGGVLIGYRLSVW